MKDILIVVIGFVVFFYYIVMDDVGISNLVLGYVYCGMVVVV